MPRRRKAAAAGATAALRGRRPPRAGRAWGGGGAQGAVEEGRGEVRELEDALGELELEQRVEAARLAHQAQLDRHEAEARARALEAFKAMRAD